MNPWVRLSTMNWYDWLRGLIGGFIGGAANSVSAVIIDPATFNLQAGLSKLVSLAVVSGIVSAALFLAHSPIPPAE